VVHVPNGHAGALVDEVEPPAPGRGNIEPPVLITPPDTTMPPVPTIPPVPIVPPVVSEVEPPVPTLGLFPHAVLHDGLLTQLMNAGNAATQPVPSC